MLLTNSTLLNHCHPKNRSEGSFLQMRKLTAFVQEVQELPARSQDVAPVFDRSRRKKENCCVDFGRSCGVSEAQSSRWLILASRTLCNPKLGAGSEDTQLPAEIFVVLPAEFTSASLRSKNNVDASDWITNYMQVEKRQKLRDEAEELCRILS